MIEKLKRVGRFTIDFRIIEDDPLIALIMLSGKVVIRAEARHEVAAVEYHAYCDDFDEVDPRSTVPVYMAVFTEQVVNDSDKSLGRIINVFERWVKVE